MHEITSPEKADLKGDALSSRHIQSSFIHTKPVSKVRVPQALEEKSTESDLGGNHLNTSKE